MPGAAGPPWLEKQLGGRAPPSPPPGLAQQGLFRGPRMPSPVPEARYRPWQELGWLPSVGRAVPVPGPAPFLTGASAPLAHSSWVRLLPGLLSSFSHHNHDIGFFSLPLTPWFFPSPVCFSRLKFLVYRAEFPLPWVGGRSAQPAFSVGGVCVCPPCQDPDLEHYSALLDESIIFSV